MPKCVSTTGTGALMPSLTIFVLSACSLALPTHPPDSVPRLAKDAQWIQDLLSGGSRPLVRINIEDLSCTL